MVADATPVRSTGERPVWLVGLAMWQLLLGVATAVGFGMVASSTGIEIVGTPRPLTMAALGIFSILALLSATWIWRFDHRGRLIAFILNLVLAAVAGFFTLQAVNVFNGLDALSATFGDGLPFLAVIAVGWLLSGWSRGRSGRWERILLTASRGLMIVGAAALLLSVGLIPGLWTFLTRIVLPPAIIYLAITVFSIAALRLLKTSQVTKAFGSTSKQLEVMDGIAFVSPNILGFLAFLAGPLAISLFVSLTDWDGLSEASFIGLRNYIDLFADPFFHRSLLNILYFGLLAIPLSIIPALGLASALNMKLPGMRLFRALYFLPAVAGVVGVALIWKQLYNATIGYINYAILQGTELLNLLPFLDLTAPQPQWLSNPSTAMLSMVIVFVFSTIGFNTVLFVAGLQGVPPSLYEAAELDGAGIWGKFRNITVPVLAPTTVFVTITTTILALQLFSEPFILNAPQLSPNGPANATLTPVIYLYQNAFERFKQGYASAIGWVLFLIIFVITLIYFRTQREEGVLTK